MEPEQKELSLITAEKIADIIYKRVTDKLYQQALFFNGVRFKIAPVNGYRIRRYIESMSVVAYYNEPSYEMILEDVHSELIKNELSEKQYKKIKVGW